MTHLEHCPDGGTYNRVMTTTTATTVQVFFRTTKSGSKIAYRTGRNGRSHSFRMGLAEAENMIATDQAVEVSANIWKS